MKNRVERYMANECKGHGACGDESEPKKITLGDVALAVTVGMMQIVQDQTNDPRDRIDAARVLVDMHEIGRPL